MSRVQTRLHHHAHPSSFVGDGYACPDWNGHRTTRLCLTKDCHSTYQRRIRATEIVSEAERTTKWTCSAVRHSHRPTPAQVADCEMQDFRFKVPQP